MLIPTALNLIIQCPCSPRKDGYEWTTPNEVSPSSVISLQRPSPKKRERENKSECGLLIKTDLFSQEKVCEMRFVSFHLCKCLQWNHILNIFKIFPCIIKSEACHYLCEGNFSLFYKFQWELSVQLLNHVGLFGTIWGHTVFSHPQVAQWEKNLWLRSPAGFPIFIATQRFVGIPG